MKHLVHALAILTKAENELTADYNDEMAKAIAEIEKRYALRLRHLASAKNAIQERIKAAESKAADIYWHLHDSKNHDIQRETNNRIKRAQRTERAKRAAV